MQPHTFWTSRYANMYNVPYGGSHAEIGRGGAASQHTASVRHPCLWIADSAVLAGGSLAHATAVTTHMILLIREHVLTCLMLRSVLMADRGGLACIILPMLVMRSSCVLTSFYHKLRKLAFCTLFVLLGKRHQLCYCFPVFLPHSTSEDMHEQRTDLCHALFDSKRITHREMKPT